MCARRWSSRCSHGSGSRFVKQQLPGADFWWRGLLVKICARSCETRTLPGRTHDATLRHRRSSTKDRSDSVRGDGNHHSHGQEKVAHGGLQMKKLTVLAFALSVPTASSAFENIPGLGVVTATEKGGTATAPKLVTTGNGKSFIGGSGGATVGAVIFPTK